MKLFVGLCILVAAYLFVMLQTTNTVLSQTDKLQTVYQRVADTDPDALATGRTAASPN